MPTTTTGTQKTFAPKRSLLSKVQQYNAKWKAAHTRIDMTLEEIKTSLEGTAIDSLEVLKVKEDQLARVSESLKESASLVDSIITEDPEQTDAMTDSEAAKAVQAVSKISACEERIARLRATINASLTSTTGAAPPTPATIESTAPSTRLATIGPQFERRPLPTFKTGKLRDYPTFKSDWSEAVNGYFKSSEE